MWRSGQGGRSSTAARAASGSANHAGVDPGEIPPLGSQIARRDDRLIGADRAACPAFDAAFGVPYILRSTARVAPDAVHGAHGHARLVGMVDARRGDDMRPRDGSWCRPPTRQRTTVRWRRGEPVPPASGSLAGPCLSCDNAVASLIRGSAGRACGGQHPEDHCEAGAAGVRRARLDAAAMRLHDPTMARPSPCHRGRVRQTGERLEDPVELRGRYAWSTVVNLDGHVALRGPDADRDRCAGGRVVHRVVDEDEQDLDDPGPDPPSTRLGHRRPRRAGRLVR